MFFSSSWTPSQHSGRKFAGSLRYWCRHWNGAFRDLLARSTSRRGRLIADLNSHSRRKLSRKKSTWFSIRWYFVTEDNFTMFAFEGQIFEEIVEGFLVGAKRGETGDFGSEGNNFRLRRLWERGGWSMDAFSFREGFGFLNSHDKCTDNIWIDWEAIIQSRRALLFF